MKRGVVLVVSIGLLSSAAAAAPAPARFAIVIGNNLPASPRSGVLRFADDDALATHELLVGAGVHSVLLARLDDATRKLHPGAVTDGAPRRAELDAAFDRLVRDIERERAAGRPSELLLFYSGHGDVEHGEGYVLLEDDRLTRTRLAELLERSPATRNHVVIDACKSYFLAFGKGPGGRRAPFSGSFVAPARLSPQRLANTGFVLSTSSDRDSHEWDRFGAGVFSHQVRSALLGAADVDHDGQISYAELGAFLTTASQAVSNPRFRPDFLIRPPGGTSSDLSQILLRWEEPARSAVVLDQPVGHVFIETAAGERILDVHAAPDQELRVRVPPGRPLFVRRDDDAAEYVVRGEAQARLSELVSGERAVDRRGAAGLAFEDLFSIPFGTASVRDFSARWTAETWPAGGAGPDAGEAGSMRVAVRRASGGTALVAGALAVVASGFAIERFATGQSASQSERVEINRGLRRLEIAAGVLGAVAVASGVVWFALRDRDPRDADLQLTLVPTAGDPALGVGVALGGAW